LQPLNGNWTDEENERLVDAVKKYGRNWEKVTEAVGKRSI